MIFVGVCKHIKQLLLPNFTIIHEQKDVLRLPFCMSHEKGVWQLFNGVSLYPGRLLANLDYPLTKHYLKYAQIITIQSISSYIFLNSLFK